MRKRLANHNEVCHFWANQTQSEGFSGNMFFDKGSIFSYGRHFEIARIVNAPNGKQVVLFTTETYSVSTARHIGYARRACNQYTVFVIPCLEYHAENENTGMHERNLQYYYNRIIENWEKAQRARYYGENYLHSAEGLRDGMQDYIETFRIDFRKLTPEIFEKVNEVQNLKLEITPEQKAKIAERARLERERILAKNRQEIEDWKQGKIHYLSRSISKIFLRYVNENGDEKIYTSWGAYIPLQAAKIVWGRILRGKPLHGLPLGNYVCQGIINGQLVAGCHKIDMEEIKDMAIQLNFPQAKEGLNDQFTESEQLAEVSQS